MWGKLGFNLTRQWDLNLWCGMSNPDNFMSEVWMSLTKQLLSSTACGVFAGQQEILSTSHGVQPTFVWRPNCADCCPSQLLHVFSKLIQ